jgi:hypothetical protein
MLLRYCLSDYVMVSVAPVITGITSAFTVHMRRIYIMRSLYFKNFSAYLSIKFLSPGIATSFNVHAPFFYHDYCVRFVVRNSSVGSHLLVP